MPLSITPRSSFKSPSTAKKMVTWKEDTNNSFQIQGLQQFGCPQDDVDNDDTNSIGSLSELAGAAAGSPQHDRGSSDDVSSCCNMPSLITFFNEVSAGFLEADEAMLDGDSLPSSLFDELSNSTRRTTDSTSFAPDAASSRQAK